MKRAVVISLIAALTFLGASILYAQAGRATSGPVGSFQLLAGRYSVGGIEAENSEVFRIDTRTGKTWTYMAGKDKNGRVYEGWGEVAEGIAYAK